MKYTFLLPAYKGRFLDEMLQSIQKQTYQDYKVVISDDCSPEDLRTICEPYLNDPRFTYRRNEENMGSKDLVAHWNMLVNMCDTEFLIMASDDDVYEPEFLEEIDKLVQKYPNVDLFRARMQRINESGDLLLREPRWEEYMDQPHFFYASRTSGMFTCEANYVYKTSALKKRGGYKDFPLAIFSDKATHIIMAVNGCINTNEILFSFRLSNINICGRPKSSGDAAMMVDASLNFMKWMTEYVNYIRDSDERDMKEAAYKANIGSVKMHIMSFAPYLTFGDFLKRQSRFKNILNLSRVELFNYWIRRRLKK
jgi:glycosyltransferase involved in cell wall biosynthesis